ncbi:hypothetical protein HZU77_015555 [Neisseriaceae bacterium TC5R-5]|nr:hypothetical protein [Neisseriaceae bacterium TC5R-5]
MKTLQTNSHFDPSYQRPLLAVATTFSLWLLAFGLAGWWTVLASQLLWCVGLLLCACVALFFYQDIAVGKRVKTPAGREGKDWILIHRPRFDRAGVALVVGIAAYTLFALWQQWNLPSWLTAGSAILAGSVCALPFVGEAFKGQAVVVTRENVDQVLASLPVVERSTRGAPLDLPYLDEIVHDQHRPDFLNTGYLAEQTVTSFHEQSVSPEHFSENTWDDQLMRDTNPLFAYELSNVWHDQHLEH